MRPAALALSLLALAVARPARAALDVEATTPYRFHVVLRFGDHPSFTPHFRAEVRRNLEGSLEAALGELGSVEAFDLKETPAEKREPSWRVFEEKGFDGLLGENGVTGVKTHFVRIDFVGGQYEISARQCDGVSGFVTPVVRKARTHARGFVGRLAGLNVAKDFGIVGTVDPDQAGGVVQVKLKGGALGVPLERWVKKGDVFAVVQVRPAPRRTAPRPPPKTREKGKTAAAKADSKDKGKAKEQPPKAAEKPKPAEPPRPQPGVIGQRMEAVLLQATEDAHDGVVSCRLLHRYEDPLPTRGVLGYRCVKLGTAQAPLQLQLVDAAGLPYKGGSLQVRIHPERFPEKPGEGEDAPFVNGVFRSKAPVAGMTCAVVSLAGRDIARIPVAVFDDGIVRASVRIEPGAETRGRFEQRRSDLYGRIMEARQVQARLFGELAKLEGDKKNQEALERAEAGEKLIDTELGTLNAEADRLEDVAKRVLAKKDLAGALGDCPNQLRVLRDKLGELRQHTAQLKEAIRVENDPATKAKRKAVEDAIRQAKLLAESADYDGAIAAYDAAARDIDDPEAKKKVEALRDALKKEWEVKDDEHAAARKFVIEKWATLPGPKEIRDSLDEARKAFAKCKAVGDRLTLGKMMLAAPDLVNKLLDEIKATPDSMEEEDQARLMALQKVAQDLEAFLKEVTAYVQAGEKKG